MPDNAEPLKAIEGEQILPAEVTCWRCELLAPATALKCPHCAAPLATIAANQVDRTDSINDDLKALVISFVILLVSGIVHGGVITYLVGDHEAIDDSLRQTLLLETLAVEVFDTIVVGVVVLSRGMGRNRIPPSQTRQNITWLFALPALACMLGLNLLYHWLLRSLLQVPLLEDDLTEKIDFLLVLTYCLQPALVEEAYFRGFALGTLEKVTSTAAAIAISAIMFGLVHLGAPFSIPYLICMGLFLGYVRVNSGTIWLPVLLHLVHNLAITWV